MPQPVLRPARKPSSFADTVQFTACALWHYLASQTAVWAQPCAEIRLYRDNPASRAFCFCRFHFDVPAHKIDFVPIKPLNLGIAKPCKRADGEHWNDARLGALCRL